jgi:hypothetical protein
MRTLFLVLLLTILPARGGQAATVDVYTGEAVVAGKEARERRQALPRALENTLQKLSGLRSFEEYPQVKPALADASSILLSFHYRNVETMLADGTREDELRLVAKFSASRVDELARYLELPLWEDGRAATDVWVVVDDGLDRRILPVEYSYAWDAMSDVAAWRGLPVNWPSPDEEGQYTVDAQLLWGGYTEDLGAGEDRGVMIAAARREGLEWNVRGNLTYRGQTWTWRLQDINLQSALTESMQQAADRVAAANTIAATDLGTWVHELTVHGLGGSEDYRRCLGYLQGLSVVDHVAVVAAREGEVTLRLQLSALPRYLEEKLHEGQVIGFDEDERNYHLLP